MSASMADRQASSQGRRRAREISKGDASVTDAEGYRRLCSWRQQHLPWLLYPGSVAVFFRLVAAPVGHPLHTRDLYRGAGASAPKVWKTINELQRKGLVTVNVDGKDRRRPQVEATNLLRRLARSYVQTMLHLL
jgi:hypothetical protein